MDVWKALKAAWCCALAGALGFGLFCSAVNLCRLPGSLAWLNNSPGHVGAVNLWGWDVQQLLTPKALLGSAHLPCGASCEVKSLSP